MTAPTRLNSHSPMGSVMRSRLGPVDRGGTTVVDVVTPTVLPYVLP